MEEEIELHIVFNRWGVRTIQIYGPKEEHRKGHDLYFRFYNVIQDFDQALKKKIEEENQIGVRGEEGTH